MTEPAPKTAPAAKPAPQRRTKTEYLVQAAEARPHDAPPPAEAWVDLGRVTVPSRTPLEGILEAARDSFAHLLKDGASARLRVTKADEIREETVSEEPQAPRLKVGA